MNINQMFAKVSTGVLALGLFVSGASAQSILNFEYGKPQSNGTYLWGYTVTAREYQDLNYWILGVDKQVYDAIVQGSVTGATNMSYVNQGGENFLSGIRFDGLIAKNQSKDITFSLAPGFTADGNIRASIDGSAVLYCTTGPIPTICDIPEPSSIAFTGVGLAAMLGICLRRRKA
ncbi:MAG: hypothetical protein RLZZ78_1017 [Armatimonadota bacterium]|jgi:hypothetical protein